MKKRHKNPDQGIWKHIFRYFVKITGWPSAILYFKPKYYYENKKVQKRTIKGKAIVISNHLGGTDIVIYTIVFIRRYLRFIAGEEAYINKFQRFFLKSFGAIKVIRVSMQQDYIYQSINTLNRGGVIQIFPEAHFPKTNDHCLQPFKSSYIIMAAQTNAPIIPCYHNAHYGLFKRDHVAIGKPIYTKDYFDTPNPTIQQIEQVNKIVENKMRELQKMIEG